MKILKVHYNFDFETIQSVEKPPLKDALYKYDNGPIKEHWTCVDFGVLKRNRKRGSFLCWIGGRLVLVGPTCEDRVLIKLLNRTGELLPLTIKGKPALFHNIIGYADCVDDGKSVWRDLIPGEVRAIVSPSFKVDKVPLGLLFCIKPFPGPEFVATDPSLSAEKDFYQWYHQQNYTGLQFKLQWDSEKPDELIRLY